MPLPPFTFEAIQRAAQAAGVDAAPPAISAPAPPKPSTLSWLVPAAETIAGNTADTLTTLQALKRPGVYEGNGVFGGSNPAVIAGVKAAMTIPEVLLERKMVQAGHPVASNILGLIIGGLGAGLAYHNSTVGKK